MSDLKLAVVKEACYPDLWVCNTYSDIETAILSSRMRIGMSGLAERFETDFLIVKTNNSDSAVRMRKLQSGDLSEGDYKEIEEKRVSYELKGRRVAATAKEHAQDADMIDWSVYDIVLCINFAVPYRVRVRYSASTRWVCIPSEAVIPADYNGWDAMSTQDMPRDGRVRGRLIDLPYTISCKKFFSISRRGRQKEGAYLEINSCPPELRHVWKESVPCASIMDSLGIDVRYHQGNMNDHVNDLSRSKYFIKCGGRDVRGNSFVEAISAGCVCLLPKNSCWGYMSLPAFCYYESLEDLKCKILALERDGGLVKEVIQEQIWVLEHYENNAAEQLRDIYGSEDARSKEESRISGMILKRFLGYAGWGMLRIGNRILGHNSSYSNLGRPIYE